METNPTITDVNATQTKQTKAKKKKTSRTDKRKSRFLRALEETYGIVVRACRLSGIGHSTYYDWLNADSAFRKKAEKIQEMAIDLVEDKLFDRIQGMTLSRRIGDTSASRQIAPDTRAITYYLSRKAYKRGYTLNPKLQVNNDVEPHITILQVVDSNPQVINSNCDIPQDLLDKMPNLEMMDGSKPWEKKNAGQ